MNTNYKRRRGNCHSVENESNEMYDKSSDTDSNTAINNICARRKAMSIRRTNVLSTSESEDDYNEDALPSTTFNNVQWAMKDV